MHDRVLDRLEQAVDSSTDLVGLWREVARVVASAVPHAWSPCFFTVDPVSRLVTSHVQEGLPEIPAAWLARDLTEPAPNSMAEVLASRQGWGTLHAATGGHPELAQKYHEEMQPYGCDQELLVALRTRDGEPWGLMGLYREVGRPLFSQPEIDLLRAAAPMLADGARRALLAGQARDPDLPGAPGMVVVGQALAVTALTERAPAWLDALGGSVERLPAAVAIAVGRVLADAAAAPDVPDDSRATAAPWSRAESQGPVTSRVPAVDGGWVALHASSLRRGGGEAEVAVILQRADAEHLGPLLMRAHGLTARERDVTAAVLRGLSTIDIARSLGISPDTVQQHLSSIFAKTSTRSRRELVAAVFHRHFEPRVRDNERRAVVGHSARGGPMPLPAEDARVPGAAPLRRAGPRPAAP